MNDNPYSFILQEKPFSILDNPEAKDVALELNSLSKTFNIPGWRVGMVLGKKEWIQAILRVKSNMDSGMFLGLQEGAIAALSLDGEWMESLFDTYSKRRNLVWKIADQLGLSYEKSTAGLFVWAKVPAGTQALELVDHLLYEKSIFVTPGSIFGSQGEKYIRFSLCVPEYKILEALKRLNPEYQSQPTA